MYLTTKEQLVAELKQFAPVKIQSVQCNLFHEQRQKSGEMVDVYAQDHRQIFHEAYPHSHQGTSESKEMVYSVLVNAGLLPFLKEKFVEEK